MSFQRFCRSSYRGSYHLPAGGYTHVASARWRHSDASDLPPAARFRKQLSGTTGPISPVLSSYSVPGLRVRLANAKSGVALLDELQQTPEAATPDFAKAAQRCGELRDYPSFCKILQLQHDRNKAGSLQQYGILFVALARIAWGQDGRGGRDSLRGQALAHGKQIWNSIQQAGIRLQLPGYGGAMQLCVKAGDAEWASVIWSEITSREIPPDDIIRSQYWSALAQHGGLDGWSTLEAQILAVKESGVEITTPSLAVLLSAAGSQHDLGRAEHAWKELLPLIAQPDSLIYCARARALLLCNAAAKVPPLRTEMHAKAIQPCFRMYKNEAQAHLLLLHECPSRGEHLQSLDGLLDLALAQRRNQHVSRNEVDEIKTMHQLGHRIAAGDTLSLSTIRVERWPWPQ